MAWRKIDVNQDVNQNVKYIVRYVVKFRVSQNSMKQNLYCYMVELEIGRPYLEHDKSKGLRHFLDSISYIQS